MKTALLTLALCFSASLLPGCITDPVTGKSVLGMPMDDEREIEMGIEYGASFKAQYEGAYPDAGLQRYCESIVLGMARNSHRPDLPWNFTILNSSEVNAFALPGGTVCITRGLLWRLKSEAQFAGVMGHEIGHVTHKHAAQGMGRQMLLGGLLMGAGVYAESSGSDWAELGVGLGAVVGQLALLKYSRGQESESDSSGIEYSHAAGYDPRELAGVFEIFKELKGDRSTPAWLSSHPLDDDRIRAVKKETRKNYPDVKAGGLDVNRPGWEGHHARLCAAQKVYEVYDEAGKAFSAATEADDTGAMQAVLGKLKQCEARLPGHALFTSGIGVVLHRMGRKDEARSCFQRASSMQDDLFEPHLYLAEMAWERRDTATVQREAQRAQELFPHHPMPFYYAARMYDHSGDVKHAVPLYESVLERASEKSEAHRFSKKRLSELRGAR